MELKLLGLSVLFLFYACQVSMNYLLKRTILLIEGVAPKANCWKMTEFALVQIMQCQMVRAIKLLIKYNSTE